MLSRIAGHMLLDLSFSWTTRSSLCLTLWSEVLSLVQQLNVVELYAGTARSCEPFKRWKRAKIALLVDDNQYAKDTYLHNFPNAPYLRGNLLRMTPKQIEAHAGGSVDILLGCPPCQGFSEIGSRGGSDPRNQHVTRFGEFIAALRPVALAIENVPLLAASKRYRKLCDLLDDLDYRWTAGILNAALRGSSQCRQRVVLIGIRGNLKAQPDFPAPSHGGSIKYFNYGHRRMMRLDQDPVGLLGRTPSTQRTEQLLPYREIVLGRHPIPTVGEAIMDLTEHAAEAARLSHVPRKHSRQILRRMALVPEGGRWRGGVDHYSQSYGRLHRHGLARTITGYFNNPGSGRYWHPVENRALTVREAARIQGFPDSFHFTSPLSAAADQVGNALDSALAEVVYRVIRSHLE